ncbi:MAG: transporter substrate-binding domain-containing protein [Beijerinckiaceae bacterium]|nr:transporter substrate-binding domain-containing protein [Beijerinckiaceae bacterium]
MPFLKSVLASIAIMVAVPALPSAVLAQAQPAVAAQQSKLDEIISRGVLRVGTTGDYRPFTYLNKDTGKFEGLDIDLAENLGKAIGVRVEFVQTSWPNLAKDFEAKAFDMAAGGVSITLDRAKKGAFSIPMMREGKTPIARCADKDKFQTIADIDKAGVRVIVNPGGTNERFARANIKAADIKVHNDNVTIFKEIAAGNADLMMTDSSETLYQQKLNPSLCAIHPEKPFDFAEKAYWLQRDVAFKDFVDQWFHMIRENGTYASIFSKWFS